MKKFIIFCLLLSIFSISLISALAVESNHSNNKTALFIPLPENITSGATNLTNQTDLSITSSDNSTITGLITIQLETKNLYYLVPIIFSSLMIIILIILITIARLIDRNRKKHRIMPIIGIQSTPETQSTPSSES